MSSEHERTVERPFQYTKTHDYERSYRGLWTDGGLCRIRIYRTECEPPLVIATELAANTNTSITNIVEYLAAEVIAAHFPERYEHDDVLTWIEHYPRTAAEQRQPLAEFSLVAFAGYTPRVVRLGGVARVRIGAPTWRHMSRAELAERLGVGDDELD